MKRHCILTTLSTTLCIAIFSLLNTMAYANGYSVSPVKLNNRNSLNSRVIDFHVTSQSPQPIQLQFMLKRWQQKNNKDIYTLAHQATVTPAISAEIPPKMTQTARIIVPINTTQQVQAYRLLIKELPFKTVTPPLKEATKSQIKIYINLSLPVFIYPQDWQSIQKRLNLQTQVQWSLKTQKNHRYLVCHNHSAEATNLTQLSAFNAKGNRIKLSFHRGYILPNAQKTWVISNSATPYRINTTINKQHFSFRLSHAH